MQGRGAPGEGTRSEDLQSRRAGHGGRSGAWAGGNWASGIGWLSIGMGAGRLIAPARFRKRGRGGEPTEGGNGERAGERRRRRIGMGELAGGLIAGLAVFDAIAAGRMARRRMAAGRQHAIDVRQSITVNRTLDEVYRFWRDLENLPRFMSHLESVESLGAGRSRWRARGPGGMKVEWQAEIVEDVPHERIAWSSVAGADVPNSGKVELRPAPGGRGTEVHVELSYRPPAGAAGAALAKLIGREPGQQVKADLRRFKQVMETGQVVHSDASIHRGLHAARPAREAHGEEQRQVLS